MKRTLLAAALLSVLPANGRAQDANYLIAVDSIEARLRSAPLNILDVRGSRAQGDRTQRITLQFADSSVLVAKLARAPVGGTAFNNEPRYELAAYEIQRLFLDPGDYAVPPTVVRAVPLTWLQQYDAAAEATFDGAQSVVVVLQYWLLQVSPDNFYDRNRAQRDTVYARHLGDFNILTYLIHHNDSNVGNFLLSQSATLPRVFSVDNGLAFESQASDRGYEWRNIRVPRLPRATVARLRAITPEQLRDGLGVLVQFEIQGDQLAPVARGANLGEGRGVRRSGKVVQFGLTTREIRGVESRLQSLLADIDKGKIAVF